MNLVLESDIKEVYKSFKMTMAQTPRTNKKMLTKAVQGGRTEARKAVYKNGIKKQTGELRKKTISKVFRKGDVSEGYIVNRSIQASSLEFGKTIHAKKKKYLTFKINDEYRKVKTVHIPSGKLGFFPSMDRYWKSNEPKKRMEKVLIADLNKVWG